MQARKHRSFRKILAKTDLPDETGLSIRQVEDMVNRGLFPPPAQLSERRIGWFADEVHEWREQRRRERDSGIPRSTQFQGRVIAGSEK